MFWDKDKGSAKQVQRLQYILVNSSYQFIPLCCGDLDLSLVEATVKLMKIRLRVNSQHELKGWRVSTLRV